MNLLHIGYCHQSVAGMCQASSTKKKKKNMLHRQWAPFKPTTRLSTFLGETLYIIQVIG